MSLRAALTGLAIVALSAILAFVVYVYASLEAFSAADAGRPSSVATLEAVAWGIFLLGTMAAGVVAYLINRTPDAGRSKGVR